ncbi:VW5B1 protein, partial [Ramphastos sulfuratus]|nr:VW5B1 protein [Ramphastos sulfuratus]
VQWEVTFDVHPLFQEPQGQVDGDTDLWSETFHHLAAKAVIRDLEQLAEKESEIEHGSGRWYQVNAVHTSKACNIISKYTAFVSVDLSTNKYLPTIVEYPHTGKLLSTIPSKSFSDGQPPATLSQAWSLLCPFCQWLGAEQATLGPSMQTLFPFTPLQHLVLPPALCFFPESLQSLSAASAPPPKSIESLFSPRLTLDKTRLLIRAAKGFMSKPTSRGNESSSEGDNESIDYLPLASLQLACGAFLLNSAFCDAISIPMEKLKWTSPFACHRLALSPSSSSSARKTTPSGEHQSLSSSQQLLVPDGHGKTPTTARVSSPSVVPEAAGRLRHFSGSAVESISRALKAEKELSPPAITIRRFSSPEWQAGSSQGLEVDGSKVQQLLFDIELQQQTEPEGMLWATAVALAWLEHSSASYFIEWELVAAKASLWLSQQGFPEGSSLTTVKAAAQQLFVLLRHWDENLEFNLLCYNPSSM